MVDISSVFLFFSCYPQINHTKIEKCLLLFTANTNILILLYRELKTDGKSLLFAVNVKLNLSIAAMKTAAQDCHDCCSIIFG